jgi:hypothetical protein
MAFECAIYHGEDVIDISWSHALPCRCRPDIPGPQSHADYRPCRGLSGGESLAIDEHKRIETVLRSEGNDIGLHRLPETSLRLS